MYFQPRSGILLASYPGCSLKKKKNGLGTRLAYYLRVLLMLMLLITRFNLSIVHSWASLIFTLMLNEILYSFSSSILLFSIYLSDGQDEPVDWRGKPVDTLLWLCTVCKVKAWEILLIRSCHVPTSVYPTSPSATISPPLVSCKCFSL